MLASNKTMEKLDPATVLEGVRLRLDEPAPVCRVCRGTVEHAQDEFGRGIRAQYCRTHRLEAEAPGRLVRAGVGVRFLACTLESYQSKDNQAAFESVQAMVAGTQTDSLGLCLTGPVGTGKTHLAVAALRGLLLCGKGGLFRATSDLLLEIKQTYDREDSTDTEIQVVKRYAGADVLVIDDLGAERVTDWTKQVFYALLNRRYAGHDRTVSNGVGLTLITTNLSLPAIAENFGDRVASRIVGMCRVVPMTGADYRLRGRSAAQGKGKP